MEFCSFASSSSGNSYLIKEGNTNLLVDCGISGKKIFSGLKECGLSPEDVDGILITHEHSDHVKSIRVTAKKCVNATVYTTAGTWMHIGDLVPPDKQILFRRGDAFSIGDIDVQSFALSHDADEPVGYSFRAAGRCASIVTDTGYITEEIFQMVKSSDLIALEANHDPEILRFCNYPYPVKRRILSDFGHLSNQAAGECLCRLIREASRRDDDMDQRTTILLSHLSKQNNTPDIAIQTISSVLQESGIIPGGNLQIEVVDRDTPSILYEV